MFVIIGTVVVLASLITGYLMHHGQLMALMQINEFIIIVGAAIGSLIVANPLSELKNIIAGILGTLKGVKITKEAYIELLKLMYELFQFAKKEGLIALEPHIENPESSSIISKYPSFLANHHAVEFFSDTLKVVLSGGVPAHDLEELMEIDLEALHKAEAHPHEATAILADAFPALGIVAAVLGVIITMQSINEGPEAVGGNVAAALVGTFLGVLLSYGIIGPLSKNMEYIFNKESIYLECIKAALLSFAKGAPASIAIEYARRTIDPEHRPTFDEAEEAVKSTR